MKIYFSSIIYRGILQARMDRRGDHMKMNSMIIFKWVFSN